MLKDLIIKNRSYRGYQNSRPVTEEELAELVDCARLTASTGNIQALKYYIAWEKEEVAEIQKLTGWARSLPQLKLPHPGMEPPAFIVILQDTAIDDNPVSFYRDCGIAAQTMLLRATEMGLGGIMLGSFGAAPLRALLQLPENLKPLLVVAVGQPAETVVLTEAQGSTRYYRDEQDVQYVPKRPLKEVLLKKK